MEGQQVSQQQALADLDALIGQVKAGQRNTPQLAKEGADALADVLVRAQIPDDFFAADLLQYEQTGLAAPLENLRVKLAQAINVLAPVRVGSGPSVQKQPSFGAQATQSPFAASSTSAFGGQGGLGVQQPTTTTTTGFTPGFTSAPVGSTFTSAAQQDNQLAYVNLDAANVKGGVLAINNLKGELLKINRPSDNSADYKKKFGEMIRGVLLDQSNNDMLLPYYGGNFERLTPQVRGAIIDSLANAVQFTSRVVGQGNNQRVEQVPTVFNRGVEKFTFITSGDDSKKKADSESKTVELILMKRPTIVSTTPGLLAETTEQHTMYMTDVSSAYSKRNLRLQVRALKLLMKANTQYNAVFAEKTGRTRGIGLGIYAPGHQHRAMKNDYLVITLNDLAAQEENALILAGNMDYAATLGRKQIPQERSFKGSGNKPLVLDNIFKTWLNAETFGLATAESASPSGCYVEPIRTGEKNLRKFGFNCVNPSFWDGLTRAAAAKYVQMGGKDQQEYANILAVLSGGKMLIQAGVGKEKLVNTLFYLAKSFGLLGGRQNNNANAQNGKVSFGTQHPLPPRDPGERHKPKNDYYPTDAMKAILNNAQTPARLAYSKDVDGNQVIGRNTTGGTVLSVVADSVNASPKTQMTLDKIPQTAFNKIIKVMSHSPSDDEYRQWVTVFDPSVADDQVFFEGVTVGMVRNAIFAEKAAAVDYKASIEKLIDDAKSVNSSNVAAAKKKAQSGSVVYQQPEMTAVA